MNRHADPLYTLRDVDLIIRQQANDVWPSDAKPDNLDAQASNFRHLLTKDDVRNMIEPGSVAEISIVDFDSLNPADVVDKHVVLMMPSYYTLPESVMSQMEVIKWLHANQARVSVATLSVIAGIDPCFIPSLLVNAVERLANTRLELSIAQDQNENMKARIAGKERVYAPNGPAYTHAVQAQTYFCNYVNSLELLYNTEMADFSTNVRYFPSTPA